LNKALKKAQTDNNPFMTPNLQNVTASFRCAGISFQRGASALVGNFDCCGTAGVRIELTPDESDFTAVRVLFPALGAEACRILIEALWESALPSQLWKAKADECIKHALEGRIFEEATADIMIKLHLYGTEAELVATPLVAEVKD
jgi:hypothetical protein